MSLKEWKNNEINTKLMKKWGLLKESAEVTTEDTEDLTEMHEGPHGPDCGCEGQDLEESGMGRGEHYAGIGKKGSVNIKGYKFSDLRNVKAEVLNRKISVSEARSLTHRILEHIQKGGK